MGMHQFIQGLNDLEMLERAPGYFKYQGHSVAAHSFRVTEIAQLLADIEEDAGQKIDWQMVYEKALNHDYTERFIGDIKTPVKYALPIYASVWHKWKRTCQRTLFKMRFLNRYKPVLDGA